MIRIFLVIIGFVSFYVIHSRVVGNLAPRLCHVLVFASYAVAALDGGIGQVGIQELRGLECLVGYLCLFCIEEVKDEIGRAQQRNIQYGRKHIFGLPEIDFLEYLFIVVWFGWVQQWEQPAPCGVL